MKTVKKILGAREMVMAIVPKELKDGLEALGVMNAEVSDDVAALITQTLEHNTNAMHPATLALVIAGGVHAAQPKPEPRLVPHAT